MLIILNAEFMAWGIAAGAIALSLFLIYVTGWMRRSKEERQSGPSPENWAEERLQELLGVAQLLDSLEELLGKEGVLSEEFRARIVSARAKLSEAVLVIDKDPAAAMEVYVNGIQKPPYTSVPISATASVIYDGARLVDAEAHLVIFQSLAMLWGKKLDASYSKMKTEQDARNAARSGNSPTDEALVKLRLAAEEGPGELQDAALKAPDVAQDATAGGDQGAPLTDKAIGGNTPVSADKPLSGDGSVNGLPPGGEGSSNSPISEGEK